MSYTGTRVTVLHAGQGANTGTRRSFKRDEKKSLLNRCPRIGPVLSCISDITMCHPREYSFGLKMGMDFRSLWCYSLVWV